MAIRKLKVVGSLKVGGVATGGVVELDDEVYNIDALIKGGLCEEHVVKSSPAPKKATSDDGFTSFKRGKGD